MKGNVTRANAIYRYCLECSGDNRAEVRRCQLRECPLHSFRCRSVPHRAWPGQATKKPPVFVAGCCQQCYRTDAKSNGQPRQRVPVANRS